MHCMTPRYFSYIFVILAVLGIGEDGPECEADMEERRE